MSTLWIRTSPESRALTFPQVGKTIIIHKFKRQTSIETSTYGAEVNAGRVVIEHCQETRCVLRSLGIEVDRPTKYYGHDNSVHESCAN